MDDRFSRLTRREMIALTGATALAGCSILNSGTQRTPRETTQPENAGAADDGQNQGAVDDGQNQQTGRTGRTVRAYVGSYHWGYFLLDEDGTERDQLTLSSGDELRLTLFNVEADDAVDALPRAVRRNVPSGEERAQRNEQAIPAPRGTSLETLHEAAEAAYPDHSLVIFADEFLWRSPDGSGQGPGSDVPVGPWGGHHGPHGGPYGPGYGPGTTPGSDPGTMPGYGPGMMPGYGLGMMPGYGPGMMPGYGPGMMPGYGPGMMPGYGPGMGGWGSGYGTLAPPVYLWHHATVPSELGFVVNTTGSFGFACTVYCGYGHPYMAERGRVVVEER